MKRVRIPAWYKGLVLKNGDYQRMLNEGMHWLGFNEDVELHSMAYPFIPKGVNMEVALKNAELVQALHVVMVGDQELMLLYENGLMKSIHTPGRYTYWKGFVEYDFVKIDLGKIEITENIDRSVLVKTALANYVKTYTVETYEKGLLFVDGKYEKELAAGTYYFWRNSTVTEVKKADLRKLQMEISGQEILTRDKAAIRLSFYVQYQVTDIVKALVENKEFDRQVYILMQLALREYIGMYTLDELLEKKENVSPVVLEAVQEKAAELGVQILGSGIRDIILPGEIKEIMNQVLVAEKKAQANTIMRREETASTRSLLNTAKLMEENAMLFKLKEMEYVEKIADKINNISLGSNSQLIDQLTQIFVPGK